MENFQIAKTWNNLFLISLNRESISIPTFTLDILPSLLWLLREYTDPLLALHVAQLLFEAGLPMTSPDAVEILRVLVSRLEVSGSDGPRSYSAMEAIGWVLHVTSEPPSLQRAAVAAIRKSVAFDLEHQLHQLRSPSHVANSLLPAARVSLSVPNKIVELILLPSIFKATTPS